MKTETWMDRSKWKSGPWDGEPDRVEWKDETTGLNCLAKRHRRAGHWCGYVGVPAGHPWHGKGYNDIEHEVHGGLTYAEACEEGDYPMRDKICHVPEPGEPEHLWWLGFDCAHCDDISPERELSFGHANEAYRTIGYVQSECESLARQAHEATKGTT